MSKIDYNKKVVKTFPVLKYCGDTHKQNTRSAAKKPLDILYTLLNTSTQSAKYDFITYWNNFQKTFSHSVEEYTHTTVKTLLKKSYLENE